MFCDACGSFMFRVFCFVSVSLMLYVFRVYVGLSVFGLYVFSYCCVCVLCLCCCASCAVCCLVAF